MVSRHLEGGDDTAVEKRYGEWKYGSQDTAAVLVGGSEGSKCSQNGPAILGWDVFRTGIALAARDQGDPMLLAYNIDRNAGYLYDNDLGKPGEGRRRYFYRCDPGRSAAFASVVPGHACLHLETTSEFAWTMTISNTSRSVASSPRVASPRPPGSPHSSRSLCATGSQRVSRLTKESPGGDK
jgi:hypothetical protein